MKKQNMIRRIFMTALLLVSFAFFGAATDISAQDGGYLGSGGGRSGYMGSGGGRSYDGGGLIGSTGGRSSGFINGGGRAEGNADSSQNLCSVEEMESLLDSILKYFF